MDVDGWWGASRPFRDRVDAGRRLAAFVAGRLPAPAIVLALPRGGVPVAYEVAVALGAPLDVFLVRKLGAPSQPELAIGAVATGGVRVLNDDVLRYLALSPATIDEITRREQQELARREREYRGDLPAPDLAGKTVVLVDDGLATGSTMRAAIAAARANGPRRIVVAIPVAAPSVAAAMRRRCDALVVVETPQPFHAVGEWYDDFHQVSDDEVRELLARARARFEVSPGDPAP